MSNLNTTIRLRILYLLMVSVVLLCGSCGERIKPDVSLHNNNVLLPAIEFTTRESTEAFVMYWQGNRTERMQKSSLSTGTSHRIVLLNLKPATEYHYQVHTSNPPGKSGVFSFFTGRLPDEVTKTEKAVIDTSQFMGFVLVRRLAPKGVDVIIDNEGDVVWYHLYDSVVRRPFVWTDHNTVLSVYDSAQIVEYDIYGDKKLDIKLDQKGLDNMLHHDAVYNSRGEIVALTHDSIQMNLTKLGLKETRYVRADGIVVFSPQAKKIWEWNLLDVYNPLEHPDRKVNLNQSLGHANSLAIDKDGNYVVSFREFSQLWKINATDGSVIWKLGEGGDFEMDEEGFFLRQHAIGFNDAGELMMFDNGDKKIRPSSRVLSFSLDEKNMQAKIKANVTLPPDLSAEKMCSVVTIEEGKYLVCTSKKNGTISVVNDNADVLWRVELSRPSYRAYYLADPFSVK